jgi:hypothetical protein
MSLPLVVAESLFVNNNAVDTINSLAIVGIAAAGIGTLVLAFRRHIGAALITGVIAVIGLGYIGMAHDAAGIGSSVGRVLRGMVPGVIHLHLF